MGVLSTREWATVFWAVILLVMLVAVPSLRPSLVSVLRAIVGSWHIPATVAALAAWTAGVLYLAYLVGLWNWALLKDTIAWFLVSGFATIFSALRVPKEDHFFRRAALSALSLTALMQFLLNLHTFHLAIELFLQPIVALLVVLSTVAGMKPETLAARKFVDGLLAILGVWIAIATARGLVDSWRGIDPKQQGLALAFSIWLPLAMLPFVYTLASTLTYGTIFRLASFRNDGHKPRRCVRAAILLGLNRDLRAANDLPQHPVHYRGISRSLRFREALGHVREYKRHRRKTIRDKQIAEARLTLYAGNKGTAADGTLLDQREFKQTRTALRWLHTCHTGHYRNLGRYREDLLQLLGGFERQGLPSDHGITMRVRRDGQAWYAWRRTVGGHVFAVGANDGPPNEWLFDGPEPPQGWPGKDAGWEDARFNTPLHWR